MKLLAFGVIVVVGALRIAASPAPRNPHQIPDHDVIHPEDFLDSDQEPKLAEATDLLTPSSKATCDTAGIISASGDALVKKVKAADSTCINQLFSLTGNDAWYAFNYDDMMTIVNQFYSATYVYDAVNAGKDSLLQLVLYLRAGLYVNYYHPQDTGSYKADLFSYIETGLRTLFGRPKMDAKNTLHYDTFSESITLVTNAHLSLKMVDDCATLLTRVTNYTWTFQDYGQGNVVNGIFNVYWRLTWETGANEQLANKMNVPQSVDNFMTIRANLLNTAGEWLLANAGGELARFMQFKSIKSKVSPLVQKHSKKYSITYGPRVWVAMAEKIDEYDKENCAMYGTCNYKEVGKSTILSITKTCSITYVDQFTIKAQKITNAQLDDVCNRLKAHEHHFHNKLNTGWKPVRDDNNWRLNVVVYASKEDYVAYNYAFYGYDTNNGGMYIEGNPSDRNNIAHFFCYVQIDWNGKWDVWNLEHEITHYFDGRYDTYGDFPTMAKYPTVWWSEGLGEYIANKETYSQINNVCTQLRYPLSSIFQTVYEDGTEKVYYYGYAASRFMFERHRPTVDQILVYLRDGKFDQYTSYMKNTLGTMYDSEFVSWCRCIAAGKPC